MFHTFAIILGIIAICILLLSVRLFFGKRFVHTHIEGNREMQKRGIHCVTHMDRMERRERRTMVEEIKRKEKMKKFILLTACLLTLAACSKDADKAQVKDNGLPKAEEKAKSTTIAYIEIDSLATQYQFCIDQQKVLEQKSAGFEAQLRKEAQSLQNAAAAFQKNLQQGKYTSEQEARNAQAAIERQQQTAAQHEAQYQEQLAQATNDYQKDLKERLENFLKEYNKDGRYAMIISNSAATMSVLYAAPGLDITADVIAGLNKQYKPEEKTAEKAEKK